MLCMLLACSLILIWLKLLISKTVWLIKVSMEHNHCLLLMRAKVFHWKMILCDLLGDALLKNFMITTRKSFVVFGIVRSIMDERPWWYSACVCGKSIQPQGGAYYCDFCQHYVTNVTPRYWIKIAVEDDNGHGVFVLFNHEAAYLLKKSCANLFGEVQKDASDGFLGKISSSDHEYIVGKKDLCEVLGERISSDGICPYV
ncbi:replication protein A 70 kDa DNA-binding subunit B isoform X1 [Arachis hypogaea]|uniref:replication protein A 70 kDa DNA-binding subunit B isoform X1 n=4 Tax=Arachis TaxID=3817 RepID=UPI000DECDEB0|nr:uncharacterized protein LOC112741301 [Arachis hypogaea]QHO06195.1 Replication factor-A carboxy-terminal domain protein [Arachis hypogaea]